MPVAMQDNAALSAPRVFAWTINGKMLVWWLVRD
jgi:hypothetical protein